MIIVDTSVWIDHLRMSQDALTTWLGQGQILMHPFVLGEVALGSIANRRVVLAFLKKLPEAVVGTDTEVLDFVERHALSGRGIGYVDAHLLVSARLNAGTFLWTTDKRLRAAAATLDLAATLPTIH